AAAAPGAEGGIAGPGGPLADGHRNPRKGRIRMKNVAVVGATGAVGQELLALLEARNFPVGKLLPLASSRSAGSAVTFRGERITVQEATPEAFAGMDLVFFAATGSLSRELAPAAA